MAETTLSDFLEADFLARPKLARGSKKSHRAYRDAVKLANRHWQAREGRAVGLQDLGYGWLSSLMGWLSQPDVDGQMRGAARGVAQRSAPTVNKHRRHLLPIWRFAAKLGRAAAVDAPEELTEPEREPIAFTFEELTQMIQYARRLPNRFGEVPVSVWWECFYQVEWCSGERVSALMLTPVVGLDLGAATLKVPADIRKDSADGRYDLLPGTVDVLRKLAPHGRVSRLFGDWPYDRNDPEWDTLRRHFRNHLVGAGIYKSLEDIPPRVAGFHGMRRSVASYLARERGIAYAQSYLGHSSPKVTERYLDPRIVGHLKVRGVLQEIGGRQMQQLRLFDERAG